jgi:hypothetical protein
MKITTTTKPCIHIKFLIIDDCKAWGDFYPLWISLNQSSYICLYVFTSLSIFFLPLCNIFPCWSWAFCYSFMFRTFDILSTFFLVTCLLLLFTNLCSSRIVFKFSLSYLSYSLSSVLLKYLISAAFAVYYLKSFYPFLYVSISFVIFAFYAPFAVVFHSFYNSTFIICTLITDSGCVCFQNFKNYDFGEQTIDGIHLSLRFSTSARGYYQVTADVSFAWMLKHSEKRSYSAGQYVSS